MEDWKTMDLAPKNGTRVDLWGKTWLASMDDFTYARFPDCYWSEGDSMSNRGGYWVNFHKDWHPTHWRLVPDPPDSRDQ